MPTAASIPPDLRALLKQHRAEIERGGVLAPLPHMLRWLEDTHRTRGALARLFVPSAIAEAEIETARAAEAAVRAVRDGTPLPFGPRPFSDGPVPVIAPPRERQVPLRLPPTRPLALAFAAGELCIQFADRLVCVGADGAHAQPLGECDFAGISPDGERLLFACRSGYAFAVYHLGARRWAETFEGIPSVHLDGAIGNTVSLVDLRSGLAARVPGHRLDGVCEYVLSPDARFAWAHIAPAHDEVGVLDVERGVPAFDPWAHDRSVGADNHAWSDDTTRALVRRADGRFRFVYRDTLRQDHARVDQLPFVPTAAAFDGAGERLAISDDVTLRVLELDANGRIAGEGPCLELHNLPVLVPSP